MKLERDSKLLRIFINELDKINHQPLYEAILFAAKKENIAGVTVIKGILSYGASSFIHTAKLVDFSFNLPVIVEIIDHNDKINQFLKTIKMLIEEADCGALITLEKVGILHYKSKS